MHVICLPTERLGVQENWLKSVRAFQIYNWNLEELVVKERGKPDQSEKNLSEKEREPTTNSTHT